MSENRMNHSDKETDPLSRFLFGSGGNSNGSENDEVKDHYSGEEERPDPAIIRDSRRDWLFGARNKEPEGLKDVDTTQSLNNNQILNNIDFTELMENIDTLVNSAGQLKPLYKKVTPIITQFLKK